MKFIKLKRTYINPDNVVRLEERTYPIPGIHNKLTMGTRIIFIDGTFMDIDDMPSEVVKYFAEADKEN